MSNNPNPQVLDDVATLPVTNDPAQTNPSQTATTQPQPLPTEQPVATQTEPAQTPATTLEGLITNVLTPLSKAVYETYNSLFTTPTTPQAPPAEQ